MKKKIWNVYFNQISITRLVSEIETHLLQSETDCRKIAFVNPHSQVMFDKDKLLLSDINQFDYILCDGVGTKIASFILGIKNINRISGPLFFEKISKKLNARNDIGYFFLGSTNDVLDKLEINLRDEYPNLNLCGKYSPPIGIFSDEENREIIKKINNSNCDILWIGLTAPKQEAWLSKYAHELDVSIAAGIGAEFDYFAGTKRRPPGWVSRFGFQWLHRLLTQRNTWRRSFVSNPIFVFNVIMYRLRNTK